MKLKTGKTPAAPVFRFVLMISAVILIRYRVNSAWLAAGGAVAGLLLYERM